MNKNYYKREMNNNIFSEDNNLYYYYYICIFKHPEINKHHLRRFTFNDNNDILKIHDAYFSKKKLKNLTHKLRDNQFKTFSYTTLDEKMIPNLNELNTCKSCNLINDYDYTGFAPYKSI